MLVKQWTWRPLQNCAIVFLYTYSCTTCLDILKNSALSCSCQAILTPDCPACSLVTIPTALLQLTFSDIKNLHSLHFSTLWNKTQNLSTCNDVSVTWVAEASWMNLHQPRCWNNHFAVFLWTNLHQHFAYMFPSRHVPATELLHVSVQFCDNSNVMFDTSLWQMHSDSPVRPLLTQTDTSQ